MLEPEPARSPAVKIVKTTTVPVFNCHVYVARSEAGGWVARGATLPEIRAEGRTEREALQKVVEQFKQVIAGYSQRGDAIPWLTAPLAAEAGELQRWIAVHL